LTVKVLKTRLGLEAGFIFIGGPQAPVTDFQELAKQVLLFWGGQVYPVSPKDRQRVGPGLAPQPTDPAAEVFKHTRPEGEAKTKRFPFMAHHRDSRPGRDDDVKRFRLATRVTGDENRAAPMPDLWVRVRKTCPQGLAELLATGSSEKPLEAVTNFRVAVEEKGPKRHGARGEESGAALAGRIKVLQKNTPVA
jgi:hypothetical protein